MFWWRKPTDFGGNIPSTSSRRPALGDQGNHRQTRVPARDAAFERQILRGLTTAKTWESGPKIGGWLWFRFHFGGPNWMILESGWKLWLNQLSVISWLNCSGWMGEATQDHGFDQYMGIWTKQDAAHEPECSHVEHYCETSYLNSLHFSPVTVPVHCRLWNAEEGGV